MRLRIHIAQALGPLEIVILLVKGGRHFYMKFRLVIFSPTVYDVVVVIDVVFIFPFQLVVG